MLLSDTFRILDPTNFFAIGSCLFAIPIVNLVFLHHCFGNYSRGYDCICFILWIIKLLFYPQKQYKRCWLSCIASCLVCIVFMYGSNLFYVSWDPFPLIWLSELPLIICGYYSEILSELKGIYKHLKLDNDKLCAFCHDEWEDTKECSVLLLICGHKYHAKCWNEYEATTNLSHKCPLCRKLINHKYRWKIHKYQRTLLEFIKNKQIGQALNIIKLHIILLCKQMYQKLKWLTATIVNKINNSNILVNSTNQHLINIDYTIVNNEQQPPVNNNNNNNNNYPLRINNNNNNNQTQYVSIVNINTNNNNNNVKRPKKRRKNRKRLNKKKKPKRKNKKHNENERTYRNEEKNNWTDIINNLEQAEIAEYKSNKLSNKKQKQKHINNEQNDEKADIINEQYPLLDSDSLSNSECNIQYKACSDANKNEVKVNSIHECKNTSSDSSDSLSDITFENSSITPRKPSITKIKCNKCTFDNVITAKQCEICHNSLIDTDTLDGKQHISKTKQKAIKPKSKYWRCNKCGIHNKNIIIQCECGAHKQIKEWQWNCHICTTTNHVNNNKCDLCKEKRVINNEWQCISCYKYNTLNNAKCNRCHKPRASINALYKNVNHRKRKKNKHKKIVNDVKNNIINQSQKPLYLYNVSVPAPPKRAPPAIPKPAISPVLNRNTNKYNYYYENNYNYNTSRRFRGYNYFNDGYNYGSYGSEYRQTTNEWDRNKSYFNEEIMEYNRDSTKSDLIDFRIDDIVYFGQRKCQIVYINTQTQPYLYTVKYLSDGKYETTKGMYFSIQKPDNN